MQIQKMPLKDRMARMQNGYPAYPEYIPCVLRSFASLPVSDYLAGCGGKWETLCRLLGIRENKDRLTYQEAAAIIRQRRRENPMDLEMAEAVFILSLPFGNYFEERNAAYEENKSDASC